MFGPGGISVGSLLLILLIVLLLFGTKRLRSVGSDLGQALKGFRKGLTEEEPAKLEAEPQPEAQSARSSDRSAGGGDKPA